MNIFVLNTGRCGSTTFIHACQHIQNYSSAHESLSSFIGKQRLAYPKQHIEADNRLSWFLGRLDKEYGNNALYVHLSRNYEDTAASFAKRKDFGIMQAYKDGILQGGSEQQSPLEIARDYIETVETNIELFLKDKKNKMNFRLESARADFAEFWKLIQAEGDIDKALATWDVHYNASSES